MLAVFSMRAAKRGGGFAETLFAQRAERLAHRPQLPSFQAFGLAAFLAAFLTLFEDRLVRRRFCHDVVNSPQYSIREALFVFYAKQKEAFHFEGPTKPAAKHNQATGAAKSKESSMSRMPPRPGSQVLESLRPTSRLKSDSARSPTMPTMPTITP